MAAKKETSSITDLAPGYKLWQHDVANDREEGAQRKLQSSPTLVVFLSWLFSDGAKTKKYVQLYTSRGFDVLEVSIKLRCLLWPRYMKAMAEELTEVLKKHCCQYPDILLHAMSLGGYLYLVCILMAEEKATMKTYFLDKVCAIVFDSVNITSMDRVMESTVALAVPSKLIHTLLILVSKVHFFCTNFKMFTKPVYEQFKLKSLRVPYLIYACRNDPFSDLNYFHEMVGFLGEVAPVRFKLWDVSGHCTNLLYHRKEYEEMLDEFLTSILPKVDTSKIRKTSKL